MTILYMRKLYFMKASNHATGNAKEKVVCNKVEKGWEERKL